MNNSKQCTGGLWKLPVYWLCLFIVCLLPFLVWRLLSPPILLPSLRRGLLLHSPLRTVCWSNIWQPAVSKCLTSLPLAELHLLAKHSVWHKRKHSEQKICYFSFSLWDNLCVYQNFSEPTINLPPMEIFSVSLQDHLSPQTWNWEAQTLF